MTTKTLPASAQKVIDHYFHLSLGGKNVPAPYYINESYDDAYKKTHQYPPDIDRFKRKKEKQRVLIGKGNPEEIEKAVYTLAKRYNFNLTKATIADIRMFMIDHDIGIDCSGFVMWILNEVYKERYQKPIWKFIQFKGNLLRKVISVFRPIENISVKLLRDNALPIKNMSDIQTGDLVISWNDDHVLLIHEVTYDNKNQAVSFSYVNATCWYGKKNGVRKGEVHIVDKKGGLLDQEWIDDSNDNGRNWAYEGVKYGGKIMRLHK